MYNVNNYGLRVLSYFVMPSIRVRSKDAAYLTLYF